MKQKVTLELPYPPSLNHYYRHFRSRVLISAKGRAYRENVISRVASDGIQKFSDKVTVVIDAYPPDNRRRDADNLEKCLFDSLVAGGVLTDDSLIKRHTTTMREAMLHTHGLVVVSIENYHE